MGREKGWQVKNERKHLFLMKSYMCQNKQSLYNIKQKESIIISVEEMRT